MATEKQIKANRQNATKGGPKSPEGKAVVRRNARKHGIFASAVTEYDTKELRGIHDELAAWIRPVGPVEDMLVEQIAHAYLRLQRCARAEAEYHTMAWQPNLDPYYVQKYVEKRKKGMHASWFDSGTFNRSVALFARYNTTLTNQFIKLLHEIERVQRIRIGEDVPPPLVADLTVHAGDGAEDVLPPVVADAAVEVAEERQDTAGAPAGLGESLDAPAS